MKCHIPGPNVKVLARTVHALARFGDELYLESLCDCIMLRTLNAAESAYAMVKFNKNFFSYFNHNYYSTEDNEGLKCKISMKSALNTFKSPTHIDKQVENLEIRLDPDACKLIFQLRCKHGIVKTHFVSILDCKAMQAIYTKDTVPNRISSHQKILSEALSNFQNSDDQVTLEASAQALLLRNYVDISNDIKVIRTQITLKPSEFDSYNIGADTTITFTLKEFRALLAFAEALNLPLQLHFETTGRPAVFIVHNGNTFEAHFVLATSKAEANTQATSTQHTSHTTKRKEKEQNTTLGSAAKKPHLDVDISKCLEEDSHLFNFVDMPDENMLLNGNNGPCDLNGSTKKVNQIQEMDVDVIPGSPAARVKVSSVFKRCFELTFDPRSLRAGVLAENSDSE